MADHVVPIDPRNLHGYFSIACQPVLEIDSGDTVTFETLDGDWLLGLNPPPDARHGREWTARRPGRDTGHALTGPVAIRGAVPGDVLEVHVDKLVPGTWGWSRVGGRRVGHDVFLGVDDGPELHLNWQLDVPRGVATSHLGHRVRMAPFMGVMGMPSSASGDQSTHPPRRTGGNIDCKELVQGSVLMLPIQVPGALFSVGDGHAAQGDGEVGSTAIECPMAEVRLTFRLRRDLQLSTPLASTRREWLTFGFSGDLEAAAYEALNAMVDHFQRTHLMDRKEALAACSPIVDLRITQLVNGIKGVHAAVDKTALMEIARRPQRVTGTASVLGTTAPAL